MIEETEVRDGITFEFVLTDEPEYMSIEDSFDGTVDELYRDVENGKYMWFCACLKAYVFGVEVGSDSIGGCMYESLEDFKKTSGYYEDMKENCVKQAMEFINKIKEL